MSRADQISGVFWFLFAVFVGIESYRLGLGSLFRPGPGFLFFWTSVALGVMSIAVMIRASMGKRVEEGDILIFQKQNILKIVLIMASTILYALLMETVGFIIVTLMLFLFHFRIVEKKGWGFTGFVSVVVTGASYLFFEIWLKSQLPKGVLESLKF